MSENTSSMDMLDVMFSKSAKEDDINLSELNNKATEPVHESISEPVVAIAEPIAKPVQIPKSTPIVEVTKLAQSKNNMQNNSKVETALSRIREKIKIGQDDAELNSIIDQILLCKVDEDDAVWYMLYPLLARSGSGTQAKLDVVEIKNSIISGLGNLSTSNDLNNFEKKLASIERHQKILLDENHQFRMESSESTKKMIEDVALRVRSASGNGGNSGMSEELLTGTITRSIRKEFNSFAEDFEGLQRTVAKIKTPLGSMSYFLAALAVSGLIMFLAGNFTGRSMASYEKEHFVSQIELLKEQVRDLKAVQAPKK